MKNLIIKVLLIIVLILMVFALSGCTLKIETTDNSVSASVDGDTTEKVDGVIDWIKDRLSRIFVVKDAESTDTEPVGNGESQIM